MFVTINLGGACQGPPNSCTTSTKHVCSLGYQRPCSLHFTSQTHTVPIASTTNEGTACTQVGSASSSFNKSGGISSGSCSNKQQSKYSNFIIFTILQYVSRNLQDKTMYTLQSESKLVDDSNTKLRMSQRLTEAREQIND
eukprot:TRINITY_DN264_c2_g1_i3.p3 TRINITY_DN264_c2_g1~~TRINITY_DN264_c2_g1_i3.p3  ORF type:complete len:140 (+),score=0.26 TRINITY_DN264_c2_g1_i3:1257-1676(+)